MMGLITHQLVIMPGAVGGVVFRAHVKTKEEM